MASAPGPPPTRDPGRSSAASVRLRRTVGLKTSKQHGDRANRQDSRELFSFQQPRREQVESNAAIAALQENVAALTLLNRREKTLSDALKTEVAQLTETLAKLNETREAEKVEQEKTVKVHQKTTRDEERILPNIRAGSTLVPSTALQQQTQMEVLSLENRCLHLTENNKKLLTMIQQLENTQTEENMQLEALRQDNTRLLTTAQDLNDTIVSQSALIVGLRSTVQRLNREEKLIEHLRHALERCQRELETVKKREKYLQEEHAQLKISTSHEKETLMSKILDFQQQLQRSEAVAGNVPVLEQKIKIIEKENETTKADLEASRSRCGNLQTQVSQLEKTLEEFVEVKKLMEKERVDFETMLTITRQELGTCGKKLREAEIRAQAAEVRAQLAEVRVQSAEAQSGGVQTMTELLKTRDEEIGTLMQKVMKLEDDVKERDQQYTGLQDELHKVNAELQGIKQLSHDETVQALQMARQKAGTHEALTLLNEEKKALDEQLRLVQERLDAMRVALDDEKNAKEKILASVETHALTIEELRKENVALLEQMKNSPVIDKTVADVDVQTIETITSPEVCVQAIEETIKPDVHKEYAETAETIDAETHAQTANELKEAAAELQNLRSEYKDLQESHDELEEMIQNLRQNQDQLEVGYKKTVSRERYKSESFQSQLKLLQNENGELSEKMEALCRDLTKEQQLNDAQMLEMTELKDRVLSPEAIFLLRKTQSSLEQTVNSLLDAEHASESTFTCLQCMQLFKQPMTLAPCGHTYCASCLTKCGNVDVPSSIVCKMCETSTKMETECIFPNLALADLTARFIFRQQSLASLTTMCLSLRNSFTQRGSNSHSTSKLSIET
ncbi:hypothetical protein PHMEG_00010722 [Phytophthora megakarya]|uniref:RING-type domain-containing protein n=1 Tax=Phytophthora megakarya TaxID=4795 RepID=A0A225WD04_9STRA|nr:hypothetical protein PHMEG_00010722 [Phytophthora megakarya]